MQPPDHVVLAHRAGIGSDFVVVKLVCRSDSREEHLLEFLGTFRSPLNHIIPLLEVHNVPIGKLLIFPRGVAVDEGVVLSVALSNLHSSAIVTMCRHLVEGVAFMHSKLVVHLDLKLPNLILRISEQGAIELQIADFDIARQCKSYDETIEGPFGTVGYVAPEVAEGGGCSIDPFKADLWACGKIIRELLEAGGWMDSDFLKLSQSLMDPTPSFRPPLHEMVQCRNDFWPGRLLFLAIEEFERQRESKHASIPGHED